MNEYEQALIRIFEGRSRNGSSNKPLPVELIHTMYDHVKFCPTSVNSSPARFAFIVSQEARNPLPAHAFDSNQAKIRAAPCVVITGHDEAWRDQMPKLLPIKEGIREFFAGNPDLAQSTAFRNGSLQGAYLMVAARLLGLDCGPMSGFNNSAIDEEFFARTTFKSNFLWAVGYANDEVLPRLPRLILKKHALHIRRTMNYMLVFSSAY